jgi:GNAT superfamily N-acetyltransferase
MVEPCSRHQDGLPVYREVVVHQQFQTRAVGPDQLTELATLFGTSRNTRRCWCMAPCVSGFAFGVGWVSGSNRRRFAAMAASSEAPMGVLASVSAEPVGWCACGPRSRYVGPGTTGGSALRDRDRHEDDVVWLVPCFFVRPDHRSRGVIHALLRSAVEVATRHGAIAIEGWPAPGSDPRLGDVFRGRESLFTELGFTCNARTEARRVVMRLQLT